MVAAILFLSAVIVGKPWWPISITDWPDLYCRGSLDGFWSLRPVERPSVFNRYFDGAGQCNALLSWHGNHLPVSFSAIARSDLIAAFAGLTRIWIKIGAAIHTVRLRGGLSSGIRLNGVRQDRQQTHRKAGS
jgi:hypothetical protein